MAEPKCAVCGEARLKNSILCGSCERGVPRRFIDDFVNSYDVYRFKRALVTGWAKMQKSIPTTDEENAALETGI